MRAFFCVSDYSAAVLAACLRADCCEIWTDVDG
ncbi:amino acid kinase family protein, partial [Escherichia sp. HC-CC]